MKRLYHNIISKANIAAFLLMLAFCSLASAETLTYTYDNLNRLVSANYANGATSTTFTYQYDAAGNMTLHSTTTKPIGTVVVNPNPDSLNASWTLTGPNGYTTSNSGDQTIPNLATGDYTISWGIVAEWITPPSITQTLLAGNSITFTGNYQLIPVVPSPPTTGPIGGTITLNGTNFGTSQGSGYVDFNGIHGIIIFWSDTQIVVKVPIGATSGCLKIVTDYGASDCINFTVIAKSDFNSDGKTDFIWQNTTTGQLYYWLMDGLTLSSSGYMFDGNSVGLEWRIDGIGDLNSDGKSDLIWRNTATGQLYYWLMDGLNLSSSGYLYDGQAVDLQWQIAGVADMNSDGKPDMIWRNTTTGQAYYWLMDGLNILSSGYLYDGQAVDLQWQIAGVGDMNSDGKSDLIWRNTSTGQVYYWLMDGLNLSSSGFLYDGQAVDLQWQIAGIADMNGDGKPDIIWRNTATGQLYCWFMDGVNLSSSGYLYDGQAVDLQWQLRLK